MSRLKPPPSSPNCVTSIADPSDEVHYIEPLRGSALEDVRAVMAEWERTELVEEADNYLHYVCRTKWIGFKDDVEFEVDPEDAEVIHVRSASRLGYGDMGVNRKRVRRIRAALS